MSTEIAFGGAKFVGVVRPMTERKDLYVTCVLKTFKGFSRMKLIVWHFSTAHCLGFKSYF